MSIVKPSPYDSVLVHGGIMTKNEIAAAHITFLREKIVELTKELDKLDDEIDDLTKPYNYMMELVKLIRNNPGLLEGWLQFLAAANIKEPLWKHEYV